MSAIVLLHISNIDKHAWQQLFPLKPILIPGSKGRLDSLLSNFTYFPAKACPAALISPQRLGTIRNTSRSYDSSES